MELLKLLKYSISQQKWAHKAEGADRSSRFDHEHHTAHSVRFDGVWNCTTKTRVLSFRNEVPGMLPWWDGWMCSSDGEGWTLRLVKGFFLHQTFVQHLNYRVLVHLQLRNLWVFKSKAAFGFLIKHRPKARLQGSQSRKKQH